jgi:ubiquinol-cytochrome c reductase cytochrome b subunit
MPSNLNFSFNFGVILLATLIFLLLTGFLSVLFYSNNLELSFTTLILVFFFNFNYFFLRVMHNTFANMFFILIYLHIVKSWFYTSNNNMLVLLVGMIIYFLSCAIAFFGYCLPMGQM